MKFLKKQSIKNRIYIYFLCNFILFQSLVYTTPLTTDTTNDILLPFDPNGFYSNAEPMEKLFRENTIHTVIEIGSWLGNSTRHIASLLPSNGIIYAVDHWQGSPEHLPGGTSYLPVTHFLKQQFISNIKHYNFSNKIIPISMDSLKASSYLSEIVPDLIYIDANHETAAVLADLTAWYPFVKGKGILCGDDWGWPSVKSAVTAFAKINNLEIVCQDNFWCFLEKESKNFSKIKENSSPLKSIELIPDEREINLYKRFVQLESKDKEYLTPYSPESMFLKDESTKDAIHDFPYLTNGTWAFFAKQCFTDFESINLDIIETNDIIFVAGKNLIEFVTEHLNIIDKKIILITSTGSPIPFEFCNLILESTNVLAWFSQQIYPISHNKFVQIPPSLNLIPLGMSYVMDMDNWVRISLHNKSKHEFEYFVFLDTNQFSDAERISIKKDVDVYLKEDAFTTYREYMENLSKSIFVLFPSKEKTHFVQIYEAILMGCIPIIDHSVWNNFYANFPVIPIYDWNDLTNEFFEKKFKELNVCLAPREQLYIPYWLDKINSFKITLDLE